MYNIYVHDKLKEKLDINSKRASSVLQIREKQCIRNSKLVLNYDKRIRTFMQSMISDPVTLNTYTAPLQIVPRDTQPARFLGKSNFKINSFSSEKERIENSININKSLDLTPLYRKHEFRTRDPQKEIHRNMSYQFSSEIHDSNASTILDISHSESKISQNKGTIQRIISTDQDQVSKYAQHQTHLTPWGQQKTHFKAVSSIFMGFSTPGESNLLFKKADMLSARKSQADIKAFIRHNSKAQRRRNLAKQVLEKCEVISSPKLAFKSKSEAHLK